MHKNESEVAQYLTAQDKNVKDQLLLKLRNLGNHIHNTEVIEKNNVPCEFCYGYYVKTELWKVNL